jgi:hypothetical protein
MKVRVRVKVKARWTPSPFTLLGVSSGSAP